MIRISSLEAHYALEAHRRTRLPIRAIIGHWTRELGQHAGSAVFPGPRRNPGNVTHAYVGRQAGTLPGGDAHERHDFPVFLTTADGVLEYSWWFNRIAYYDHIAAAAAGDWRRACDLIERSPWSSSHYGGTLDATARECHIALARASFATELYRDPSRAHPTAHVAAGALLALSAAVPGGWYRVRFGPDDGRVLYAPAGALQRVAV